MPKPIDLREALRIMTDEAEAQHADANDTNGAVRAVVTAHGFGFEAWFCVCCELADRSARRQGFRSEVDRAYTVAQQVVRDAK
jgi:hypothetical protein